MKVITVRQPWAWAIARGHKDVENRSWSTTHRGLLAIHSAKRWDDGGVEALRRVVHTARAQGATLPPSLGEDRPWSETGLILSTVELVDICTAGLRGAGCDCGPWAIPGQAHWQLASACRCDVPILASGRLGLWDASVEVSR